MTSSAGDLLATVVARAVADFAGHNAYVRGGNAVHAVATVRWLGELEVPAPLCHVGVSGGELAALRPTNAPVTCRRCLRRQGADGVIALPPTEQLALFPARVVPPPSDPADPA